MVIVIQNRKNSPLEGFSDVEVTFSIFVIPLILVVIELYTSFQHNIIDEYVELYNRTFSAYIRTLILKEESVTWG